MNNTTALPPGRRFGRRASCGVSTFEGSVSSVTRPSYSESRNQDAPAAPPAKFGRRASCGISTFSGAPSGGTSGSEQKWKREPSGGAGSGSGGYNGAAKGLGLGSSSCHGSAVSSSRFGQNKTGSQDLSSSSYHGGAAPSRGKFGRRASCAPSFSGVSTGGSSGNNAPSVGGRFSRDVPTSRGVAASRSDDLGSSVTRKAPASRGVSAGRSFDGSSYSGRSGENIEQNVQGANSVSSVPSARKFGRRASCGVGTFTSGASGGLKNESNGTGGARSSFSKSRFDGGTSQRSEPQEDTQSKPSIRPSGGYNKFKASDNQSLSSKSYHGGSAGQFGQKQDTSSQELGSSSYHSGAAPSRSRFGRRASCAPSFSGGALDSGSGSKPSSFGGGSYSREAPSSRGVTASRSDDLGSSVTRNAPAKRGVSSSRSFDGGSFVGSSNHDEDDQSVQTTNSAYTAPRVRSFGRRASCGVGTFTGGDNSTRSSTSFGTGVSRFSSATDGGDTDDNSSISSVPTLSRSRSSGFPRNSSTAGGRHRIASIKEGVAAADDDDNKSTSSAYTAPVGRSFGRRASCGVGTFTGGDSSTRSSNSFGAGTSRFSSAKERSDMDDNGSVSSVPTLSRSRSAGFPKSSSSAAGRRSFTTEPIQEGVEKPAPAAPVKRSFGRRASCGVTSFAGSTSFCNSDDNSTRSSNTLFSGTSAGTGSFARRNETSTPPVTQNQSSVVTGITDDYSTRSTDTFQSNTSAPARSRFGRRASCGVSTFTSSAASRSNDDDSVRTTDTFKSTSSQYGYGDSSAPTVSRAKDSYQGGAPVRPKSRFGRRASTSFVPSSYDSQPSSGGYGYQDNQNGYGGYSEAQQESQYGGESQEVEEEKPMKYDYSGFPEEDPLQDDGGNYMQKLRKKKAAADRERNKLKIIALATKLQALCRGFVYRKRYLSKLKEFQEKLRLQKEEEENKKRRENAIVKVQAVCRAYVPRLRWRLYSMEINIQFIHMQREMEVQAVKDRHERDKKKLRKEVRKIREELEFQAQEEERLVERECKRVTRYLRKSNLNLRNENVRMQYEMDEMREKNVHIAELTEETNSNYDLVLVKLQELQKRNARLIATQEEYEKEFKAYHEELEKRRVHCIIESKLRKLYNKRKNKMVKLISEQCQDAVLVSDIQGMASPPKTDGVPAQ